MANQSFISYSKKDSDYVHKLADDLSNAGFNIWIDRSIGGGEDWRESIEKNLRYATDVIVAVSPNSMESSWVQHEGSLAYGWEKNIIPILISPVPSLPPWLEEYQWIDFVNKPYSEALDALITAITPLNPIQDLLDIQVITYQQTGQLMSAAIYQVVEEAFDSLQVNENAKELIQKSQLKIKKDRRIAFFRWLTLASGLAIALVITTLGVTGQLNQFIFRPLPMEWISVDSGDFMMGSSEDEINKVWEFEPSYAVDNEKPQHPVYLDSYRIGKYEVTNKQYSQCVRAGICSNPTNNNFYGNKEFDNHPVVGVNWDDARTFCEWNNRNGGRLPTEAEWERAARGDNDTRQFPWGDEWDDTRANVGQGDDGSAAPFGSYPKGISPFGAADMAGNVWEWVMDWDGDYTDSEFPQKNPLGPDNGERRILRGGSFYDALVESRVTFRLPYPPGFISDDIGFRCAKDGRNEN